ncbi:MAG: DUF4332 domain-containing protein [Thermodesulfobacteriota bacterium]
MKKIFPLHGIIGAVLLLVSEIFLFKKADPFYRWFYCFAWWSYILIIDAVIYRLKGNSLILTRTKEFFLMIPWSLFIWLIFEAANLILENWYYINLPHARVERWLGYAMAYGTVLPGIFETTELLETLGLFKNSKTKSLIVSSEGRFVLSLLGMLWLLASINIPEYFFPLIWVGFTLLLDPINYRFGGRSLLRDLEEGSPRKIYLLLIAGLICGFLWEFWNFWALSKWIYTVPFFEKAKGFEMPFLGFLGFPPFAVQVYVIYNTLSLLRHKRGWEETTYQLNPEKRSSRLTVILAAILIFSFSVLVFRAIDSKTVDSYEPRLKDAYWIEARYREMLPKIGITSLEDLVSKTGEKKECEELALRLLIPKEDLIRWVEYAKLAQIKGLGVENLRILEQVGIHSVTVLTREDPDRLYEKMRSFQPIKPNLRKAKIRIWIREAQRKVKN